MTDHTAFASGYRAALRDINGPCSMERAGVVFADPAAAADRAYEARGDDWLAPLVAHHLNPPRGRQPARPRPRAGTIYVLGDAIGRVKIGWTGGCVTKRVRSVEHAAGCCLTLLASIAGTQADEASVHDRFGAMRLRGEWFSRTPAVDAWLATLVGARS
jgi:Meiotically up-regulated gene 113